MKKVEKIVVALIILAALIGGLIFVFYLAGNAQEEQEGVMAAAYAALKEGQAGTSGNDAPEAGADGTILDATGGSSSDASSDADGTSGDGMADGSDADGTSNGAGANDGNGDGATDGTDVDATADADGEGGDDGSDEGESSDAGIETPSISTEDIVGDILPDSSSMEVEEPSLTQQLATGELAALEAMAEEGLVDMEALPQAGAGEMSVEELVAWMETESIEALAAQYDLAFAEALALGVGTADDPERRAFAESQGEKNYEATMNNLEEQVSTLAYLCLTTQAQVTLAEEQLEAFTQMRDLIVERASQLEVLLGEKQTELIQIQEDLATLLAEDEATQLLKASLITGLEEAEAVSQGEFDLLTQELSLVAAALTSCDSQLEAMPLAVEEAVQLHSDAKIVLNTTLGNEPTAELEVIGSLVAVAYSSLDSDALVEQALLQRNEISGAAYSIVTAEKALTQLRYSYAPDSPEIIAQESAVESAKAYYLALRNQIQGEIISAVSQLELDYKTLVAAQESLATLEATAPAMEHPAPVIEGSTVTIGYNDMMTYYTKRNALNIEINTRIAQFNQDMMALEHAVSYGTGTANI